MTTYQPASFGVVDVKGPGGWWIGVGQALAGDSSRYKHAFLILDETGTILEGEPGGARLSNISEYAGDGLLISDAPVQSTQAKLNGQPLRTYGPWSESAVRAAVIHEAQKLVGVPYSALDYLALALLHLHLPSSWVRNRVEKSGHMICSQLVDAVYERAGIHLFDDGRLPGDVAPADLAAYAEDHT